MAAFKIKSAEGMFVLIKYVMIEAGLYESSWFVEVVMQLFVE